MNIVRVSQRPNGIGRLSTQVGIPLMILNSLPEGITHMTVELRRDELGAQVLVYKPIIKEGP